MTVEAPLENVLETQCKPVSILESYIADLLRDISSDDAECLLAADLPQSEAVVHTEVVVHREAPVAKNSALDIEKTRPARWSEQPLQCLVFSVGDTRLAATLTDLHRVQVINQITPLVGQSELFCGVATYSGEHIRIVDTMRLLMRERFNPAICQQYNHVLVVKQAEGQQPWGLAVTAIDDSICIEPKAVRWAKQGIKQPWLLGTIVEPMCSLLDIAELDKLLTRSLALCQ